MQKSETLDQLPTPTPHPFNERYNSMPLVRNVKSKQSCFSAHTVWGTRAPIWVFNRSRTSRRAVLAILDGRYAGTPECTCIHYHKHLRILRCTYQNNMLARGSVDAKKKYKITWEAGKYKSKVEVHSQKKVAGSIPIVASKGL